MNRSAQEDIAKRLFRAFDLLNLEPNTEKLDKLANYAQFILKWNSTYNLTALKTIEDIYVQHLYDSLAVTKPIETYLLNNNIEKADIYDVGSGAGLPGVVLSVMFPQIEVVCIDSVEKKIAFIKHVAGMLQLKNLTAQHKRIESWKTKPVQIVISRAFSSLANFTKLAGMHVENNGRAIAMKAHLKEDELDEFKTQKEWQIDQIDKLNVPEMTATRCLVWMSRTKEVSK